MFKKILDKCLNKVQGRPIKINLSLGFILEHIPSSRLVYFYAGYNTEFFDVARRLATVNDYYTVLNDLTDVDWIEYFANRRPDTNYVFLKATNVQVHLYLLK